jgi:hypothetical protein
MAFDKTPSVWLGAGYSHASHAISLNTADASSDQLLTILTDADADETTGDIRQIIRSVLYMLDVKWAVQDAGDDLPAKMRFRKSLGLNSSAGEVTETYVIEFDVTIASLGGVATE